MLSSASLTPGESGDPCGQLEHDIERGRRENTVLRGQLFEPSEEDPSVSVVRSSVYTIPNALVAEQFTPSPQPQPLETSESPRLS